MTSPILCWVRRDLRLHDHAALAAACASGAPVHLVFVFDPLILDKLTDKHDRRVTFIIQSLQDMERDLQKRGASLHIRHGDPTHEIPQLATELGAHAVYANRDYEPYAKKRDETVGKRLHALKIDLHQFKDAVGYEKTEVLKDDGSIYKVFTPYKNKWLAKLASHDHQVPDHAPDFKRLALGIHAKNALAHDWHEELGFTPAPPLLPGGHKEAVKRLKAFSAHIASYKAERDIPSIDGTSNLSPYIRHGCLSIRDMIRTALAHRSEGASTWLSEIVWRDFYQMILDTHPYVEKGAFKREYDAIQWRGKKEWFDAWCEGRTGFPLVDAAMRCLAQTGMMHNRLRMVTASFLCKTLLIDWRKGEHHFAVNLLDFDLAANNGGWQWCSSTGCDAQPYFRIFNPWSQSEKFDPDGVFIKAWVPELAHLDAPDVHKPEPLLAPDYPRPIVSYEKMRGEALAMYKG